MPFCKAPLGGQSQRHMYIQKIRKNLEPCSVPPCTITETPTSFAPPNTSRKPTPVLTYHISCRHRFSRRPMHSPTSQASKNRTKHKTMPLLPPTPHPHINAESFPPQPVLANAAPTVQARKSSRKTSSSPASAPAPAKGRSPLRHRPHRPHRRDNGTAAPTSPSPKASRAKTRRVPRIGNLFCPKAPWTEGP